MITNALEAAINLLGDPEKFAQSKADAIWAIIGIIMETDEHSDFHVCRCEDDMV
jgi:hypothetical protein